MNKDELGKKITDMFKNEDKEFARVLMDDIINYVSEFYNTNIKLNAIYEGLNFASSRFEGVLTIKHITLNFKLDDRVISFAKTENGNSTKLDDVIIENGKALCKHGEFTLEEIDKYLAECFQELF